LQDLLTKERNVYLDTYGQGWAVTHFLTFDNQRSAQLRQYLAALGQGKSLEQASKAFGDLAALNRDARRYVTAGSFEYRPVKVDIARPVIERTRALTQGEIALLPETIAFRDEELSGYQDESDRKEELAFRQRNLSRIREKAGRFPSDPQVQLLLAEAEDSQGNYREAEAAVDRLLAVRPDHRAGVSLKSTLPAIRMTPGLSWLITRASSCSARRHPRRRSTGSCRPSACCPGIRKRGSCWSISWPATAVMAKRSTG
jgi:hypothetical protein